MPTIVIPQEDLRIGNELRRKYLNILERLAGSHEAGRITDREFYLAWRAVYETISGLLDWDLVNDMERGFKDHMKKNRESPPRPATSKTTGMGTSIASSMHRLDISHQPSSSQASVKTPHDPPPKTTNGPTPRNAPLR